MESTTGSGGGVRGTVAPITDKSRPHRCELPSPTQHRRMPRALRLEFENDSYHVIDRGNYRGPVFAVVGTKRTFFRCLDGLPEPAGTRQVLTLD